MPIEKPILTDITGDSVGLTWRPARVPSNSTPPTYNVEIRKLPNMNWQRLAGGLTMTTYKATKLNPDRSYMFRIKAENEYGTSGSTMPASLGRPGSKFSMKFDHHSLCYCFCSTAVRKCIVFEVMIFTEQLVKLRWLNFMLWSQNDVWNLTRFSSHHNAGSCGESEKIFWSMPMKRAKPNLAKGCLIVYAGLARFFCS